MESCAELIGEAQKCGMGCSFNTVDELINRLKKIYGPNKSVYQLQRELGSLYQWEKVNVVSYAIRIQEIGNKIIDAHKMSESGKIEDGLLQEFQKDIINCFRRGLRSEIESRIIKGKTYAELVNQAIDVERTLRKKFVLI